MKDAAPRDLRALPKGTRVSDYRLESVLGHGGFGITYLATDLLLNQRVAIKEYYPREFAVRDRSKTVRASGNADDRDNFVWGLERFREEARTLARFSHPNVVAVRRLFEANGTSYIVMDFCEGEPLDQVIRRDAPLPASQLERLFSALLDGLEHVHAAGVMHRDLKPANIFIRADGSPVLLDFGAARQALVNHSQSMTSLATAHYAAFEQYSTNGKQGPWTDIYGLAATCYHAATGEKPMDAPDRILEDKLQPLVVKAAGRYRRDFLLAIDAGLAVRPEDRPQSIDSWRRQLTDPVSRPMGLVEAPRVDRPEVANDYKNAKIGFGVAFLLIFCIAIVQAMGSFVGGFTADGDANVIALNDEDIQGLPPAMGAAIASARAAQVKAQQVSADDAINCPDDAEQTWDECNGLGQLPDNKRYKGEFISDNPSGSGVILFPNGDRYEGEVLVADQDGFGVLIRADGSKVEGQWAKGKINGYAQILDAEGNVLESGLYVDDILQ